MKSKYISKMRPFKGGRKINKDVMVLFKYAVEHETGNRRLRFTANPQHIRLVNFFLMRAGIMKAFMNADLSRRMLDVNNLVLSEITEINFDCIPLIYPSKAAKANKFTFAALTRPPSEMRANTEIDIIKDVNDNDVMLNLKALDKGSSEIAQCVEIGTILSSLKALHLLTEGVKQELDKAIKLLVEKGELSFSDILLSVK